MAVGNFSSDGLSVTSGGDYNSMCGVGVVRRFSDTKPPTNQEESDSTCTIQ